MCRSNRQPRTGVGVLDVEQVRGDAGLGGALRTHARQQALHDHVEVAHRLRAGAHVLRQATASDNKLKNPNKYPNKTLENPNQKS